MKTLVKDATLVNEGRSFKGHLLIEDNRIAEVIEGTPDNCSPDCVVDASGCYVIPGVIDDHVHFREPGLTHKADIESESRAAAYGGVTTYFDMPNTNPQTTTLETLDEKFRLGARNSHVNYSFFFGATNDNYPLFASLDPHRIPGIKLFMGSSTGNMLVDRDEALNHIFASAAPLPIMAHCEDTGIINRNMADFKARYGDDPEIWSHPLIRSEEACLESTVKAIELAIRHDARLHVAHVTTAAELELFPPFTSMITAEATVGHLVFSMVDYKRLGARIKVNPAIKNFWDCQALRDGLSDGRIAVVSTDHAPHLLSEKQGGAARAVSGMPMIQFSLLTMLELVDQEVLGIERLVELMCHNPARLFDVSGRGFLRPGYRADIVIIRRTEPWTVTPEIIQSKCKWSPMEGHEYRWQVRDVFCNGHHLLSPAGFDDAYRGEAVRFRQG
ncbi:MAG: dihydroorotase [Prevotella sp.]|nr:dihydroorotase [Prevotella sp.]